MMRIAATLLALAALSMSAQGAEGWRMNVIGDQVHGADGVRLRDVNGDGRPDVAVPFEEGGEVRLYLHPGRERVRERWPSLLVGRVADPEDAVAMDIDGDGRFEVISSTERQNQKLYIHRQGADGAWQTVAVASSGGPGPLLTRLCEYRLFTHLMRLLGLEQYCWIGRMPQRWMYALPLEGESPAAFIAGSKEHNGSITLFRKVPGAVLGEWAATHLARVGWVMSIIRFDYDGDGRADVIYSDRRGPDLDGNGKLDDGVDPRVPGAPRRGIFALRGSGGEWTWHTLAQVDAEIMFMDVGDLDGDGIPDIVAATKAGYVLWLRGKGSGQYEIRRIPVPQEGADLKAVAIGDMDGDGQNDLVLTVESAAPDGLRVYALLMAPGAQRVTRTVNIGGRRGQKFDRIELLDIDGDGDLDVLTTEELEGLGVIWYENPAR